jgi:peptidoglycan/LPS O-acetylase OafA/YrhL
VTTDIDTPSGTQTPPTDGDQHLELPFGWEEGPGTEDSGDRDSVFRFPSADDPEPRSRRLLGMALYSTVFGMLGLAVGVRGLLSIIGGGTPGWYEPALAGTGLLCVALVVGAFLSIHRRVLPWLLLIAAAVPLAGTVAITAAGH